ncbi:MAG TPA: hypothetical protein VK611_06650 [Acidimicrobiales bacterium]|nr:hypothetical protein [Acidimicrobiales bacterium]
MAVRAAGARGPVPFGPASGPLASPAPSGGRTSVATAQVWGAVSVVFGVLVLIGSAVPWFAESSFALTDDMSSAWPLVVVGLVGVLGGVDGLRGSLLGPAVAAGAGSVFVLLQVVMLRAFSHVPGVTMGGGGVAWTLAAGAGVLLVIAVLSALRADREQGTAPGWLGAVVLVAGAAWVAGMVMPATPGLSMGGHVEYVLFGGDTFSDVMTVAFISIPAALVLLAAATRSRAAYGLAAGSMVFWTLAAVTGAAGYGSSGDGALRYVFGQFWPMLLGALGVAIGGCVAMLQPGRTAPFPAPGPTRLTGTRPVVALAPVVGIALLPVAGIIGAVQYTEGQDAFGTATVYEPFDESDSGQYDDPYGTGSFGDGGIDGDVGGGSLDVVCTGLVDSTIRSAWQDVDGAIHVIVFVDNDCEIGQELDDPAASFTLTSGGANVADATFDFSSRPVVVPAFGRSETEIVFGPGTFVDLGAVETLGLGADTTAAAGSLVLSHSYTCTDVSDASDASDTTAPSVGTEVAGEATDSPVAPQTTTESDALARLAEIAQADEPFVGSDVTDRWVPQISSKKPNVTLPNGTVWDAVSILEDHRVWRERFPRVRLLWSGDYSTYERSDFWVTIVAVPFDTADGAVGWCDANGLPAEDCYAKLISHTHPHEASTQLR